MLSSRQSGHRTNSLALPICPQPSPQSASNKHMVDLVTPPSANTRAAANSQGGKKLFE